jgi:hypothetical protein
VMDYRVVIIWFFLNRNMFSHTTKYR